MQSPRYLQFRSPSVATCVLVAFIAAAVAVALAAPATAAPDAPACSDTITVMNGNNSGAGSLRQAIADVCTNGTIFFNNDMTVTLASQLVINKGLTIEGQERRVTISGNNVTRVFLIQNVSTGAVNLNRLTIANGWAGNENGGGIKNDGSNLKVNSCLLTGNGTHGSGGAIYDSDILSVVNSTFTGNTVGYYGGAIYSDSQFGSLILFDSTITSNSAGYTSGLDNSAAAWGALAINTIIAHQTTGVNCNARFSIGSQNNLSNFSSCGGSFTRSDAILLGALGDYGGVTRTIPLLPGSAAIDAGGSCSAWVSCPTEDARGFPYVGTNDIGAFESQGFNLTIAGGNNQTAALNTAFATPLSVTVAPNQPGEPVNGGRITFTAPASGASASLENTPATINAGVAGGVTATANGVPGTYAVTASAGSASAVGASAESAYAATFNLTNTTPAAVTLASFAASVLADHVLVTWETVSEMGNAGFNLYRTTSEQAPAASDLLAYVPSQAPGSTQGFAYSYQDQALTAGESYWYWLEDVSLSGVTTLHGPVSVVLVGPTAVTLGRLEAATDRPALAWLWLPAMALLAAGLAAAGAVQARPRRRSNA